MPRGRPLTVGVARPPCPKGHEGRTILDGHSKSRYADVERPRYRCVPKNGSKRHPFVPEVRIRHTIAMDGQHLECSACERELERNDGVRVGAAFEVAIPEMARLFMRLGQSATYRGSSEEVRRALGKKIVRGRFKGMAFSNEASLAMNYLDVFGDLVIATTAPTEWPRIVSVDALPLKSKKWTGPKRPGQMWPQTSMRPRHPRKRMKLVRAARMTSRGCLFVATGKDTPFDTPRPILIRFMGGNDEESWTEFLESLAGAPTWIVSDGAGAIINAVKRAWPYQGVVHYRSEIHLVKRAALAAAKDRIPKSDVVWGLLETIQSNAAQDYPLAEARARTLKAPSLRAWLAENRGMIVHEQTAKRAAFRHFPRSSGATESTIERLKSIIKSRGHLFNNADRTDRLLALVRADIAFESNEVLYSKAIRAWFVANHGGKGVADWPQIRDPKGTSSIRELVAAAVVRARSSRHRRGLVRNERNRQVRQSVIAAQRQVAALPPVPRRLGKNTSRVNRSVAGMTVADFPALVAEWHPTKNGAVQPGDQPAGTGRPAWWKCAQKPDHEWSAQIRSRTIRSTRCPFCTHRLVALSDSLLVSHPHVAAEWHPTKNGDRLPKDFTYGSEIEVVWQCLKYKTHVWTTKINSRTNGGTGCPACVRVARRGGRFRGLAAAPFEPGNPINLPEVGLPEAEPEAQDPPATEDAS